MASDPANCDVASANVILGVSQLKYLNGGDSDYFKFKIDTVHGDPSFNNFNDPSAVKRLQDDLTNQTVVCDLPGRAAHEWTQKLMALSSPLKSVTTHY
ncbi:uncharacterized protein L199_005234 [Kwoniella botswanensis]|uniref:uncharacterized protein n=1 Tax=Kwoniella botswanensis TaxID=1268659 RepID=UPI00315D580A